MIPLSKVVLIPLFDECLATFDYPPGAIPGNGSTEHSECAISEVYIYKPEEGVEGQNGDTMLDRS